MTTVIDAIRFLPLVACVGGISSENLFLLGESEIGPHHADQNVGQRNHLLPGQSPQSLEIEYAVALTTVQGRLKVNDGRMRSAI